MKSRAAALQVALIGVLIATMLVLRPRGLLGRKQTCYSHCFRLAGFGSEWLVRMSPFDETVVRFGLREGV